MGFFCCFITKTDQKEIIKWSNNRKIKWEDFQGHLEKDTPIGAASSVGIMYKVISHSYERYFLEVYAGFLKKKSCVWIEKATDTLLWHEQGHFDLTEIYSRKLRKVLTNIQYKYSNVQIVKEVDIVFNIYADSLSLMQKKYDVETHYSNKLIQQKHWISYIQKELKSFEKYNNPYITIFLKKE